MSTRTEAVSPDPRAVRAAMLALVYDRYGSADVLQIRRMPTPAPGRGEILVRVRAAALDPKDVLVREGRLRLLSGPRFPKQVGSDRAGEVARSDSSVSDYRVGDRVFGMLNGWSGCRGSLAQYLVTRPAACARMPPALSFEDATAIPLAAQTALQALRDLARVREGDHVCINGGSGGVYGRAEGEEVGTPELSLEELTAACREARRLGLRVASHAVAREGIDNSVEAGCDTIEHGQLLDEELIGLMKARGTWLVPTIVPYHTMVGLGTAGGIPAYAVEKSVEVMKIYFDTVRRAFEAGLNVALGTDSGPRALPHSVVHRQAALRVEHSGLPRPWCCGRRPSAERPPSAWATGPAASPRGSGPTWSASTATRPPTSAPSRGSGS